MGFVSGDARMVQLPSISPCDTPINKVKGKNLIISVDAKKKKIVQISTSIHDKTLNKTLIKGKYLIIIKAIFDKPTANFICSNEKLSFPSKNMNKRKLPTAFIQHRTGSPSQSCADRTRNKKRPD